MEEKIFDPNRPPPTVSLSYAELEQMYAEEEAGHLPKGYVQRYFDGVDANVFGHDAQKDRKGFRLEQGLGSKNNQTQQSIDAYKKYGRTEPNFEDNLKRMEAELADSNAARKVKTAKRRYSAGR